ncbi:hypothetical protein TIFTF001_027655 [Ficus carica]|uniref:Uncharacterized protein n=1 Tax=Ficus carica TaxID=3494 RepID=A0AA88ANT4_FICCA|nr:hypothetical protein TIFTF001_025966 [Ficus carica]GMN58552.1 hypothetical protein TIFTF001_027655 [Ficus carica]
MFMCKPKNISDSFASHHSCTKEKAYFQEAATAVEEAQKDGWILILGNPIGCGSEDSPRREVIVMQNYAHLPY